MTERMDERATIVSSEREGLAERTGAEDNNLAAQKKKAVRSDWDIKKMPFWHTRFTIERHFTKEQRAALSFGHIPQEMEDKWFFFMEDNKLYAHRSWTGVCVYVMEFSEDSDLIKVTANRSKKEYSCKSKAKDIEQVNSLLTFWTQENYDYYHEWIAETVAALENK